MARVSSVVRLPPLSPKLLPPEEIGKVMALLLLKNEDARFLVPLAPRWKYNLDFLNLQRTLLALMKVLRFQAGL